MQVEDSPVQYWKLTYLQYMVKPQLLIDYIRSLLSGFESSTHQSITSFQIIALLFDSLSMTLSEALERFPPFEKTKTFKQIAQNSNRIKRLPSVIQIWKQTANHRDTWIQLLNSFKGNTSTCVDYFQQELLSTIHQIPQDIKLIFDYYRNNLQFTRLKKNHNMIREYKGQWIIEDLGINLNKDGVNGKIRGKYLQLIKNVLIVIKCKTPQYFLNNFVEFQNNTKPIERMIQQKQNKFQVDKKNKNPSFDLDESNYLTSFKFPKYIDNSDCQSKISYVSSLILNYSQLINSESNATKYKSFINQILTQHQQTLTKLQKSKLYSFLLILKIINYSNSYQPDLSLKIFTDISEIFKQIKSRYQLSINSCIQLMNALSYLQNFIPLDHYPSFHKMITSMMQVYENQKQKKQYFLLVIYVTFFSLKLNSNSNPLNFTKLWKKIIEGDRQFINNIYSISFMDYLIGFNYLVNSKNKNKDGGLIDNQIVGGLRQEEVFGDELEKIKNVQIEIAECFKSDAIIELLQRKKYISQILERFMLNNNNNQSSNSNPPSKYQQSLIQLSKYYILNRQFQPFLTQLKNYCSFVYLNKIFTTNSISVSIHCLPFKLLSNILRLKGLMIPSLISVEMQQQKLNIKRFIEFHQMIQRSRQIVQTQYLRFCSPQLLKILLKYCKRTMQDAAVKQIVKLVGESINYQYFTMAKRGRVRIQKQYQFVKWIYAGFISK